jgi:hypothetical protein
MLEVWVWVVVEGEADLYVDVCGKLKVNGCRIRSHIWRDNQEFQIGNFSFISLSNFIISIVVAKGLTLVDCDGISGG